MLAIFSFIKNHKTLSLICGSIIIILILLTYVFMLKNDYKDLQLENVNTKIKLEIEKSNNEVLQAKIALQNILQNATKKLAESTQATAIKEKDLDTQRESIIFFQEPISIELKKTDPNVKVVTHEVRERGIDFVNSLMD